LENSKVDYWVTGSSGHIGVALTRKLIKEGSSVLGIDRVHNPELTEEGFSFTQIDLGSSLEVEQSMAHLPTPQRGLVHLAALTGPIEEIGWGGSVHSQSLEFWESTFAVNVSSAFLLSKEVARRDAEYKLPQNKAFPIVFVSSIYGSVGPNPSLYGEAEMRNPAAYGASKAALESLARYVSTTSSGRIRANSVAAGGIRRNQDPDFVERYSSRTPAGRMATEEDILRVLSFLLCEDSRYMFGQTLFADGGFTIW
jgi:NAD(P)-dependent dehydrogenase (short-subunit alcohol dehydrogenase family)